MLIEEIVEIHSTWSMVLFVCQLFRSTIIGFTNAETFRSVGPTEEDPQVETFHATKKLRNNGHLNL